MIEEPALALEATAIAGEGAVGPDHAMAGDDNAEGVGAVGQADGADGRGPPDARGKLRVGDCRPARNVAQSAPHVALEGSAGGRHGQGINGMEIAGKVAGDGAGQTVRIVCGMQFDLRAGVVALEETLEAVGMAGTTRDVGPESGAKVAFKVCNEEQVADGREKAIDGDGQNLCMRRHREIFSLAVGRAQGESRREADPLSV